MQRTIWIAAVMAACAASVSPSQAFTDADVDRLTTEILESKAATGGSDAINDLSSELIGCSVIMLVGAICIGKALGEDSNAARHWETISSWTGKLGVLFSEVGSAFQRGHSAHASRPLPMTLCATFLLTAVISRSFSNPFTLAKHSSQVPLID
jgi:hypothetical protein